MQSRRRAIGGRGRHPRAGKHPPTVGAPRQLHVGQGGCASIARRWIVLGSRWRGILGLDACAAHRTAQKLGLLVRLLEPVATTRCRRRPAPGGALPPGPGAARGWPRGGAVAGGWPRRAPGDAPAAEHVPAADPVPPSAGRDRRDPGPCLRDPDRRRGRDRHGPCHGCGNRPDRAGRAGRCACRRSRRIGAAVAGAAGGSDAAARKLRRGCRRSRPRRTRRRPRRAGGGYGRWPCRRAAASGPGRP